MISGPTHTAFHHLAQPQLLSNLLEIASNPALVLHDRSAADHFQVLDLGQIRQQLSLDAVGKVSVLFFLAQILKGQDGNRLIDLVRGNSRQEKEPRGSGNDHSSCDKHDNATTPMRSRCYANALRGDIKDPSENEYEWKSDK